METTPKNPKVCFSFDRHADAPQIPRVQDVLYALELSIQNEYYSASYQNNDTRYLANIAMVVEVVGKKAVDASLFNSEKTVRNIEGAARIIARAIVDLCPEEAACLLREAYINAKRLAGDKVPLNNATINERRLACTCNECTETVRDQSTTD